MPFIYTLRAAVKDIMLPLPDTLLLLPDSASPCYRHAIAATSISPLIIIARATLFSPCHIDIFVSPRFSRDAAISPLIFDSRHAYVTPRRYYACYAIAATP